MPRISRQFIDSLIARADIVEVIDSRLSLKKAGREYKACCPFHGEKTPSFMVSPSKQFYHCFGCGASGNALGFIMEFEHMDFVEAVETLAQDQGVDVEYETNDFNAPAQPRVEPSLYDLLSQANDFFRQQLPKHPVAVEYLKQRGLSGETARDWQIGYAPDSWDALKNHLSASDKELEAAGLISKNETGRVYDKFRDRIMFPIRDRRGRVIAFGGRVMKADDGPKYLNSPETAVFHKGQELFGLYEARKNNRKLERLIVVEGYMDVIGLYQYGVTNAVATLGTATTADHLQRLFRVIDEVVFCFDGDRAGRDAAWKALNVTLPLLNEGKEVYFLFLADGEDPDTLVKAGGKEAFDAALAGKQDLTDFLFDALKQQHDSTQAMGMTSLVAAACTIIASIQSPLLKSLVTQKLARFSGYNETDLKRQIGGGKAIAQPYTTRPAPAGRQIQLTPMRMAVAVLLQHPKLANQISVNAIPDSLGDPGIKLLNELIDLLHEEPHLTPAMLAERFREHEMVNAVNKLISTELGEAEPKVLLHDSLKQIHKQHLHLRWEELLLKSRQGTLSEAEKNELRRLTQQPN